MSEQYLCFKLWEIFKTKGKKLKKTPFIGYYDYWVILTYLSIVSAVVGMYFAFDGNIRYAIYCMMFSGLFDTFDGRVAALKKKDSIQSNFGIQIDAMADLVSFGVLPAIILYSLGQSSGYYGITSIIVPAIYVLAAFIRLAYFAAIESESKDDENKKRKNFRGLPTTSVALLIPLVYFVCDILQASFFEVLSVTFVITALFFILNIKIPKPGIRTQIILCSIGLIILLIIVFVGGNMSG